MSRWSQCHGEADVTMSHNKDVTILKIIFVHSPTALDTDLLVASHIATDAGPSNCTYIKYLHMYKGGLINTFPVNYTAIQIIITYQFPHSCDGGPINFSSWLQGGIEFVEKGASNNWIQKWISRRKHRMFHCLVPHQFPSQVFSYR